MRVLCEGLDLNDAVMKVIKAISSKTTKPILEGIKISAVGGELVLTATDLELAIEKRIKAEVLKEGETVVAGRLFADFIKRLTNERIELIIKDNNRLKILYSGSEGIFSCFNADEFPKMTRPENPQTFSIVKKEFRDLINKVSFSVSTDDDRPVFKGILLEIEEFNINAVAIDGSRLALCTKALENKSALMSIIVPARSLLEISKIIEDNEEILTVYTQKDIVMVDIGHTKVTSRIIDGDFINYRQIFPTDYNTKIRVYKEHLEASLERAGLLAKTDKNNEIKLDIRENIMNVSSNSQMGNVNENVTIALEGKDLIIAFNQTYISDALSVIKDEYVQINFIESISPCVIMPIHGEEYKYLILPVRPSQG